MWDLAGMRRASVPLLLALALAGALGCGSSSSGGSTQTGTSTQSSAAHTPNGSTSTSGSSLKVNGRPSFATPPKSEPVQSGEVQLSYRNITVRPGTLRVKAGTTVRFTNYDPVQHNATSVGGPQKFASGNFGEDESFAVKLTKPGLVHFECTLHPATINGTIEVLGG
jgi:plastocyanin